MSSQAALCASESAAVFLLDAATTPKRISRPLSPDRGVLCCAQDTFLAASLGGAMISGMQNDGNLSRHTAVSSLMKHFAL